MNRIFQTAASLLLGLVLVGCASPGQQTLQFAVSRIAQGDQPATFAAAESVLTDMGYVIDVSDPATGRIRTQATAQDSRPPSAKKTVRISGEAYLRRVVRVRVAETEESVNVYCQVAIQELDTESHRIMQQQTLTADRAGETAIDRGAATTIEQNTVWRTIDRDRTQERKILNAIGERVGAAPATGDSTSG